MLASMVKTGTDAQFTYDHNGLRIKNVVHMAQGDVVALIDANGTQMVEYGYDAWGNLISKSGSVAATIGVSVYILPEWMTGTVKKNIQRKAPFKQMLLKY